MVAWIVALDAGGTTVKSAAVPLVPDAAVEAVTEPVPSRGPAGPIIARLAGAIRRRLAEIPGGEPVAGFVVALPGPFDYDAGVRPPGAHPTDTKYVALAGIPLAAALADSAGIEAEQVRFVNDAVAAARGEARYGAGRGYRRVLMVTLGTGLGSALVADGSVVAELNGVPVGKLYALRLPSGRSADEKFSHRGLQERLAAAGDESEAAADLAADLGAFLAPFAVGAVDVVVVGGGVGESVAPHLDAASRRCGVPVVPGALGSAAALLGAATLYPAPGRGGGGGG